MATDTDFDQALAWLAESERKSKSAIVRELVFARVTEARQAFRFGALAEARCDTKPREDGVEAIVRELKSLDEDAGLDALVRD
ncbi:MAG: hypothetical protein ACPGUV_12085 [Polyangiales bacterium]